MSVFTILLGGRLVVTERLKNQIAGTRIIAADGGMSHAEALDVVPEKWIGDFDSSAEDLKQKYAQVNRETHDVEKDASDGELATRWALKNGATKLILCGALGGERSDHAIFHMMHALALAEQGVNVLLTSGDEEALPILLGLHQYDCPDKSVFSIMAFSQLTGLSIRGAYWPLENYNLSFGISLTLSNKVCGDLLINLDSGRAMLFSNLHYS